MRIYGKEISRVLIIDDDPEARDGYAYPIEELELEPVKIQGPVTTPQAFIEGVRSSDAVVCDYHLKKHSYAACDGDVLIAECYKAKIPGMLCTTFTDVDVTIRRDCLRYIPALLKTSSPEPNALITAWGRCLSEMNGTFHSTRKPWRTLVRVEEIDHDRRCFYAVLPAWDSRKKVRIDNDSIPENVLTLLEPGKRFHAEVNTGAESYAELFFDAWESK